MSDSTSMPEVFRCEECHEWYASAAESEKLEGHCFGCAPEVLAEREKAERLRREGRRGHFDWIGAIREFSPGDFIEELWPFKRDGYVYLLGGEGYYKIGRSRNVSKRIRQLEIQLPWPVTVEHTIPCENHKVSERTLHDMFANNRANGEWFRLDDSDVDYIKAIGKMRGPHIQWVQP